MVLFLNSCTSYTLSKDFFGAYSYDEIADVDTSDYIVSTDFVDHHFPELGTISSVNSNLKLNYKPSKHYKVTIVGKHIFSLTENNEWNTERPDSICITDIVITSKGSGTFAVGKNKITNNVKSPVPVKILKELRDDFLKIKKLTRHNLTKTPTDWNYLQTSYVYLLD